MSIKNSSKKILAVLVMLLSTYLLIYSAYSPSKEELSVLKEEILQLNKNDNTENEEQKEEFKGILENLFLNRNSSILSRDSEGLKCFYDMDKKPSKWAYESELQKINYFANWSEKQGSHFTKINSIIKISKVKEKEPDLYTVICYVSTDFHYSYEDQPRIDNRFKLGTCHYINLKKQDDKYVITKEWYTDPLADSLDMKNIKSDDIKTFILSHEKPEFTLDERTEKAINYAHTYCGVADDEEHLFKYNKNYKNFNPDGGDCANFASQILFEGGGFKKNDIWNYEARSGTKSWVNAQGFKNYMVNSGRASYIAKGTYSEIYKDAFNLRPGDFVGYEKKGRITHISTVTGLDSKGYPLVTCHNTDRLLVPYDLGWSNSNIKFHLIDVHY